MENWIKEFENRLKIIDKELLIEKNTNNLATLKLRKDVLASVLKNIKNR